MRPWGQWATCTRDLLNPQPPSPNTKNTRSGRSRGGILMGRQTAFPDVDGDFYSARECRCGRPSGAKSTQGAKLPRSFTANWTPSRQSSAGSLVSPGPPAGMGSYLFIFFWGALFHSFEQKLESSQLCWSLNTLWSHLATVFEFLQSS